MRTLCLCNSTIPWGGGEKWHLEAAVSLAARGWRVLLVCHPQGELYRRAQQATGVTVVPFSLGRLSFLNPLARLSLRRFFHKERVDTLIMNLPADLKIAGPAARSAGVQHIIYRRGSALPVKNTAFNRRLFSSVITHLLVNSQATRDEVLRNNADLLPAERITVLPNGIDVAAFDAALAASQPLTSFCGTTESPLSAPSKQRSPTHCAASANAKPFILGNAGRLYKQKGQHLLLHLGKRVLEKGLPCEIHIAGDGEREQELRALAQELGIQNNTVFHGFMADLSPFWQHIDLFVLTSLWEGFGNVLLEAMLARKPIFAFAVSNIPELISDGVNGRLFPLPQEEWANCPGYTPEHLATNVQEHTPYATLASMAEAVCQLAADKQTQQAMGTAGRQFAEGFAQNICMDKLEALIKK